LPAHAATAGATQLHQADAPQPHDSTPDQIDHGLDPSAFQLDHADPAALQLAVHALSTADQPSFSNAGAADQPGHDGSDSAVLTDIPDIDVDQLAHAAHEVASAPLSAEAPTDGSHAAGSEPIPISDPSDPFTADASQPVGAPDEPAQILPPLPDHSHDQSLDHLSSLS
jgi:hypothetical protein